MRTSAPNYKHTREKECDFRGKYSDQTNATLALVLGNTRSSVAIAGPAWLCNSRKKYSPSGQSSPGNMQSVQHASNGIRQMPQLSSFAIQRHVATPTQPNPAQSVQRKLLLIPSSYKNWQNLIQVHEWCRRYSVPGSSFFSLSQTLTFYFNFQLGFLIRRFIRRHLRLNVWLQFTDEMRIIDATSDWSGKKAARL